MRSDNSEFVDRNHNYNTRFVVRLVDRIPYKLDHFRFVYVCLSVVRITQKLLVKFLRNFTKRLEIIQGPIS